MYLHPPNCLIQLVAELDHILERAVLQDIKEGWERMISKIIIVAEEERDNANIEVLLSFAPDNITDGNLLASAVH